MEASPGVQTTEGRVADSEEVLRAVNALSEVKLLKLHEMAEFLAYTLRRQPWGMSADDLLQEATTRLLEGTRKWKPEKVDLVGLLWGIMKSIVSGLRESAEGQEQIALESDLLVTGPDGKTPPSPLQKVADPRPDPERMLILREAQTQEKIFQVIEELFVDDPLPAFIFSERKRGTKGSEIMSVMGLTRQQYDTAVRRMFRAIEKRWPGGMPDVC